MSRPPQGRETLLEVQGLSVRFPPRKQARIREPVTAVQDVSLSLSSGETLALVGESGSGKSTTALALMGLVPPPGEVAGQIQLSGEALDQAPARRWRQLRGRRVAMIFQDPEASLNPVLSVGTQIAEVLRVHKGLNRRTADRRSIELLERVGIPNAARRRRDPPSRFSGGQRQRIMIACALAGDPTLLVADEPTTALDVTTQARIVDLLRDLQRERGMGVLWVSHDLRLVRQVADRVAVMENGRVVESGPTETILTAPTHPATQALLQAAIDSPRAHRDSLPEAPHADGKGTPPVLRVTRVTRTLGGRHRLVGPDEPGHPAVQDVSLTLGPGDALGIVGESGAGKTTLGRLVAGLELADSGEVRAGVHERDTPPRRADARIQVVFQDPFASLNPRKSVRWIVAEPLRLRAKRRDSPSDHPRSVTDLLRDVGLPEAVLDRYPWQLSGGERQRVALARALAADPALIVLDEPVSSLDPTIRAQVLELLQRLRRDRGTPLLMVSHDFGSIARLCDRVAVMFEGRIIETGPLLSVLHGPLHPCTRELVAAAGLHPAPRLRPAPVSQQTVPDGAGCTYLTRCHQASDLCARIRPELTAPGSDETHLAACHHPDGQRGRTRLQHP